jgi:hypothetical protein
MVGERTRTIPLRVKIIYTAFVSLLVPAYTIHYGPANFLWFSNIALLAGCVAVWRESSLLASMMAVGTVLPEIGWNIGFWSRVVAGADLFGLTGYMFNPEIPLFIRGLSLYHVVLPPLLVWLVYRLGYDARAVRWQTVLGWVVLLLSYAFSDPEGNINWVYGFRDRVETWLPEPLHLLLLMAAFPLLVYWPTHVLLKKYFGTDSRRDLKV